MGQKVRLYLLKMEKLYSNPLAMHIILPGFSFKPYIEKSINGMGEEIIENREAIYETTFEIDIDQIESLAPSAGPISHPKELSYSRIVGKSGRYYDINLSFKDLQFRVHRAKQDKYYKQLIIISN